MERVLHPAFYLCCLFIGSLVAEEKKDFSPEFFVFRNGVAFGDIENEVNTIKKLGFHGISQDRPSKQFAEKVKAYEKQGLKVLSIYLNIDDKPIDKEVVIPLANKGGMIELTVRKMMPTTVESIKKTVEMAQQMDIKVALYPHHGFAVATMPQAMALIEKVNHTNLGVMFNLCHFLKSEDVKDLELVLEEAGDRLFSVSTSGADVGGKSWNELIQTLDKGDFQQERLFKQLKAMDYKGPVGLQCYKIKGDKKENLKSSFKAWKDILSKL